MAGLGSRFKSEGFDLPKPLIKVNGKTLIEHSIDSLNIEGRFIFITRKFEKEDHNSQLSVILKTLKPDSVEIKLDYTTSGAVETALSAKQYIDNDDDLIITNCDQRLEWDSSIFSEFILQENLDGCVVTYDSDNPKNSFAIVDEESGYVTEFVEKRAVSRNSLIGVHYWKKGSDFISSGEKHLDQFQKNNQKECYISESYNYLIEEGKKMKCFRIPNNEFIPLGTPYDVSIYQGKIKEFYTEKPKTIFCDIDGTIMKHVHRFSDVCFEESQILPGVLDKFNEWDSQGHKIILCTARKESARQRTEEQLRKLGLCWDTLIMGVTSGNRVIINDKLNTSDANRAVSVNVITNSGFEVIDWKNYNL